MKKVILVLLAVLLAVLPLACGGSSRQITRLDPNQTTDLSGAWNDTDARLVAEEMVKDAIARPWLADFNRTAGKKPVVTVGTIRNMTSEHINTETFSTDFERELINSGQVRFVASKEDRSELRDERQEQQEFASPETVKKLRNETGADFVLLGSVKDIVDEVAGTKTVFYQTDFQLINVETMEKVWIGTKKIKKGISQGSTKW
ncbi:MAG: penicillin-binding protein activator LpoB [Candidatus Zixiibacteriota bacterium]